MFLFTLINVFLNIILRNMKKGFLKTFLLLSLSVFTLTGCDFLNRILNPETIFDGGYIYDDPDYHPDENTDEAFFAECTYKDYVNNNYYNKSSTPLSGSPKLLLIPIWFNDSNIFIPIDKKEDLRNDMNKAYFGSEVDTGWHSVSSFYKNESNNKLILTGKTSNWYECNKSYTYYAEESSGRNRTLTLANEVVNWYFSNNPADLKTDYDLDGDGFLDGVILIYAAPNWNSLCLKDKSSDYESYRNLWAYCFWASNTSNRANPALSVYFWASYDFMYDYEGSNGIGEYGFGGDGYFVDAHTYIHETGHMLGLEDYYDYGDDKYCPAGGFSMEDETVGGHDPYSVFSLGWASAYVPYGTTTLTITPFQKNHEIIILSPSFNNFKSPFDEYLILEFYDASNLNEKDAHKKYMGVAPTGAQQPGIRLWHVDARLQYGSYDSDFTTSRNITTNPKYTVYGGGVLLMNSNTYDIDNAHATKVKEENANLYNLLQLIHADNPNDFLHTNLRNLSIFTEGKTFNMQDYKKQFVKNGLLNSGKQLGFSFTVKKCTSEYVTVDIIKDVVL